MLNLLHEKLVNNQLSNEMADASGGASDTHLGEAVVPRAQSHAVSSPLEVRYRSLSLSHVQLSLALFLSLSKGRCRNCQPS